jgi:Domain of unknown function (DUF4395)
VHSRLHHRSSTANAVGAVPGTCPETRAHYRPRPFGARRASPVTSGSGRDLAQGIGVAYSLSAAVLALGSDRMAADIVLALLATAAPLESAFGFCLGCRVLAVLIRLGVVPDEICLRCAGIFAGPH